MSSTQASETSIRTSIVVDAPIERAFRVFTEGFGSFKPPEHKGGWPLYLQRFADVLND
jgi:hypothetical protein